MKKNYIILIMLIVLLEIGSLFYAYIENFLYVSVPTIIIFLIALACAFVFYCIKNNNEQDKKIDKFIIVIFIVITLLKIIATIPVLKMGKMVEIMKEVDNNYSTYHSYEELKEVIGIKESDLNYKEEGFITDIPYFGYNNMNRFYKNFYLMQIIVTAEQENKLSYSQFIKQSNKTGGVYGTDWIKTTNLAIENCNNVVLGILIIPIIFEIIFIVTFFITNKKNSIQNK